MEIFDGIDGVIWDIDGVLIDSEPLHYEALLHVCRTIGVTVDSKLNQKMLGLSLPSVYDTLRGLFDINMSKVHWIESIERYYIDNLKPTMMRPNIDKTIRFLSKNNIPIACVSTGERRIVNANLDIIGLSDIFPITLSREDVLHTKPHPEPYITAAKLMNLNPKNCLAIEDSLTGLESARAAKMSTLGFPHDMSLPIPSSAADYVVNNICEIPWHTLAANKA